MIIKKLLIRIMIHRVSPRIVGLLANDVVFSNRLFNFINETLTSKFVRRHREIQQGVRTVCSNLLLIYVNSPNCNNFIKYLVR